MASPLEVMEKVSPTEKTGSIMDHEQALIITNTPKSEELLEAFSSDCMALENIAQEFESRDEHATDTPGIIDLDIRNSQNDGIESVLHILDKNISSASANNNGVHPSTSHANKRHRHKNQNAVAVIPPWTIGGVIDEFIRVHNCEPLLESDEESDNESCYSRGAESQAGNMKDPTTEDSNHTERRDEQEAYDNQDDEQASNIKSLQDELEASRQKIASLEGQIHAQFPSPTQITHIVQQKREVEELAIDKRMLEAQLASTHHQLTEAKKVATNATAKVELLQEHNKQLEDELFELKQRIDNDHLQTLSGLNSTSVETCHNDPPSLSNMDCSTIQQLRLDLNEAHSALQRLKKESAREKKHYHRLLEGANSSKADLESRLRIEMDNNLEMRRKCYVLDQKMAAKKKLVIDLEAELNSVTDELTAKGRENESLIHQVDHLKKLLCDENQKVVEMDCLQDINESLNEELTKSLEENKRLREQLRRFKKVSTHKTFRQTVVRGTVNEVKDDEISNSATVATGVVNKDVFAKALDYLNEVESEGIKHGHEQITMAQADCSGEERQSSHMAPQTKPCTDELDILQESRKRFESMRLEFYGE